MKRLIFIYAIIAAATTLAAEAATPPHNEYKVQTISAERHGNYLTLDMNIALDSLKVRSNRAVLLTPVVANGGDEAELPSVGIYGRRRYFYYKRNDPQNMISGPEETSFRWRKRPAEYAYHHILPFEPWMDGATILLSRSDWGCCKQQTGQSDEAVGSYNEAFFPELIYVTPAGEREKRRVLEGRAYIDFPVDRTVIYPEYRRNSEELAKIRATIDVVRDDRDATIDTVWLKGFASPESPYQHNTELAVGRMAALKSHIQNIYNFDDVTMVTEYEPEDWEGLRKAVVMSNLPHKREILEIIDGDREPDVKEWLIKSRYKEDYRYMLDNFYPALRHTDYRVSYVVRTYSEPQEILEIMRRHPQNLGLNEFYVAAGGLEPGSEEFTELFETAVRMFPDDEAANLNAANAAMRRGDNERAAKYLEKAGSSAEALYARGALAVRTGDCEAAERWLGEAAAAGLDKAAETLEELKQRFNLQ